MKITKYGHCCLLIETKGKRILTDLGSYTIEANAKVRDIDFVLFTHEHRDHYHLESLKTILTNNPRAVVYANDSVSALLTQEGITHTEVAHMEQVMLDGVPVIGIGEKHAMIHSSLPLSSNLGFFIDGRLWYPGDNFTDPKRPVDILALPVSGPWMKISEAIDYVLVLKPKVAFPVHDAIRFGMAHGTVGRIMEKNGLKFVPMVEGDVKEF